MRIGPRIRGSTRLTRDGVRAPDAAPPPVYTPSLDFSDARNSQYAPIV